jgi:hypothetical protein
MKTNFFLRIIAAVLLSAASLHPAAAQKAPETKLPGKEQLNAAAASYQTIAGKKFYLKAYGNYTLLALGGFRGQGAPPNTERIYEYYSNGYPSSSQTEQTLSSDYTLKNTFGSGLRVGGGIGLVINDFINLGIDGEYVLGSQTTENYIVTVKTSYFNELTNTSREVINSIVNTELMYNYRILNIIPNITFKAISKPEYYIYNRLGLVIGIPSQLSYTNTQNKISPDDTGYETVFVNKYTYDLEKNLGLGYQAALGIQFRISESLRGFSELVASNQQIKSDKSTLSDAQYKSYTPGSTDPNNNKFKRIQGIPGKTSLDLIMPVNSVGVSLGIALRF